MKEYIWHFFIILGKYIFSVVTSVIACGKKYTDNQLPQTELGKNNIMML